MTTKQIIKEKFITEISRPQNFPQSHQLITTLNGSVPTTQTLTTTAAFNNINSSSASSSNNYTVSEDEISKKLPKEILLRILSYLDVVSLCRCAQVSIIKCERTTQDSNFCLIMAFTVVGLVAVFTSVSSFRLFEAFGHSAELNSWSLHYDHKYSNLFLLILTRTLFDLETPLRTQRALIKTRSKAFSCRHSTWIRNRKIFYSLRKWRSLMNSVATKKQQKKWKNS